MKLICIMPLVSLGILIIFHNASPTIANIHIDPLDQARPAAMLDFSKTKLFKMDSVFDVTSYDTLHRIGVQRIDQGKFKGVIVKTYADIIAVNIIATPFRWLLDTMERIGIQNRRIP